MASALDYFDVLGFEAVDVVTGFEGVVSDVSFNLYGCVMVTLTPKQHKDKIEEASNRWFDHKRITITSNARVLEPPREWLVGREPGPMARPADPRMPVRG